MNIHIVGVRHHSPACARLVRHSVLELRPRYVLIEGPSDVNAWMDELYLEHRLPIAVFSHVRESGDGTGFSSWSPFCEYSPEWIALKTAREVGAEALFIDLPAWHKAFSGIKNRYADRKNRYESRILGLCKRFGMADSDSLWDMLFEEPMPSEELSARLNVYFEELRGDDPGDPETRAREVYMASWIAWASGQALGESEAMLVVCGGYHAPALKNLWKSMMGEEELPRPDKSLGSAGGQSYLVPYSFRRLDAFVGYEAGMPSPAYYQRVWEDGPESAAESMLFQAISRLRSKGQAVSAADVVAASAAMQALMRIRGHRVPLRVDVLDALAQVLVKEALEVPLPWEQRGMLAPRTDPMLVEVVVAFSGDQKGELARETRRPPLVQDAMERLEEAGIPYEWSAKTLELRLEGGGEEEARAKSRLLHGLRVLGIPGFQWIRGSSGERDASLWGRAETWVLKRELDADSALIEAAAYGATLPQAAASRIEEMLLGAEDVGLLSALYIEALRVGAPALGTRLLRRMEEAIGLEPSFEALGMALSRFLTLYSYGSALFGGDRGELFSLICSCFDRGLWLFEGLSGRRASLGKAGLHAIIALRDTLFLQAMEGGRKVDELRRGQVKELMLRRVRDADAPVAVAGAALGFLWSVFEREEEGVFQDQPAEQVAIAAMRAAALPETLGDFLGGLFALAREPVQRARSLLSAADTVFGEMSEHDFLVAAPSLRMAFSYFPPRERQAIAERVLEIRGVVDMHSSELLSGARDARDILLGRQVELEVSEVEKRYGLLFDEVMAREEGV